MKLSPAAPRRQCVQSAAVLVASVFAVHAQAQTADTATLSTPATPLEEVFGRCPARQPRQQRCDQPQPGDQGHPAVDQRRHAASRWSSSAPTTSTTPCGWRPASTSRRLGNQPHQLRGARLRDQEHADRRRRPAQWLGHRHRRDGRLRLREARSDPRRERPAHRRGQLVGHDQLRAQASDQQGAGLLGVQRWFLGQPQRVEADYSTPFTKTAAGPAAWWSRARMSDSYLRGLSNDRAYVYGVVDGQIGENAHAGVRLLVPEGQHRRQHVGRAHSSTSDGSAGRIRAQRLDDAGLDVLEHDRPRTPSPKYTFGSATLDLKATYNYRANEHDSKLFFGYSPTGLDPVTERACSAGPTRAVRHQAHLVDVSLSGRFDRSAASTKRCSA